MLTIALTATPGAALSRPDCDRWSRPCAATSLAGSDAGLRPAPKIVRPKSSNYFADLNVHFNSPSKGQESGHPLGVRSSDSVLLAEMADDDDQVRARYEGRVKQ